MMIGPRDPNVLAWLAGLEPGDRLATMMALCHVFTILTADKQWQRDMAKLRAEVQPTGREAEDLLVRAASMGTAVKREMSEGGAKPVSGRRKKSADRRQTNLMLPVAGGKELSEQVGPKVDEVTTARKTSRSRNRA
jgi:hypothetical protein